MAQDPQPGIITTPDAERAPAPRTRRLPPTATALLLCIGLPVLMVGGLLGWAVLSGDRENPSGPESPRLRSARQSTCISNQRQIAIAIQMYALDHGEILPDASSVWADLVLGTSIQQCPSEPYLSNGYGYNTWLSARPLGKISDPSRVVCTADSTNAINLLTDQADLAVDRHGTQYVVSYMDGHVSVESAPVALK